MNPSERKEILRIYALTAAYYREKLQDEVLRMYVADLDDIPFQEIRRAFDLYRKNRINRRTPMPADLVAILNPESSPVDEGNQVAALLLKCVARKGYNWTMPGSWKYDAPTFPEAVIKEVGTLGWAVIQDLGGWAAVCDYVQRSNPTTVVAQIRDLATAIAKRATRGDYGKKPELPGREESKKLIESLDQKRITKE